MKFRKQISFSEVDLKIGNYRVRSFNYEYDYTIEVIDSRNYMCRKYYEVECIARRKLYKIIKELRRKRDIEDNEKLWEQLKGKQFDELPKK